jgi:hypothetical protein
MVTITTDSKIVKLLGLTKDWNTEKKLPASAPRAAEKAKARVL